MDRLHNAAVFAATTLGIEPHPVQVKYLLDRHKTKVLVGGRRSGKTTSLAIETIFHAIRAVRERRPSRQLLVAPAVDQARLLFDRVSNLLSSSPLGGLVESEVASPFPELRLSWGGTIFVRAAHEQGRLLRGHSADRVVVDEAAFLQDRVIEESIGPILADTGGQLVLASTPGAKGSLFHDLFERGKDTKDERVRSFSMRSLDNPHVDAGYIEAQRGELTEVQFQVEYEGAFMDQSDVVFRWDHLAACAVGAESRPREGHRYVIGWDPAVKRDRSGIVVMDVTTQPWSVVHLEDLRGKDYVGQVREVARMAHDYHGARVVVDQTAHGEVLVNLLAGEGVWVQGYLFTSPSKAELISSLAVLLEKHNIIFPPARDLVDELRYYQANVSSTGHVKYGAPTGSKVHDDLVTAFALAVHGAGGRPLMPSIIDTGLPPFLMSVSEPDEPEYPVLPGEDMDSWESWRQL